MPSTEQEYQQLITHIRRLGHVQEAAPGNIATILQARFGRRDLASTTWTLPPVRPSSFRATGSSLRLRDH